MDMTETHTVVSRVFSFLPDWMPHQAVMFKNTLKLPKISIYNFKSDPANRISGSVSSKQSQTTTVTPQVPIIYKKGDSK